MLARDQAGQPARFGSLLELGGRRCVAFPLPAGQHIIDLDAHAPIYRLCVALTRFAGKTCAGTILSPNTVRLTVRGELVEPPAVRPEPFDFAQGERNFINQTVLF